MLAYAGLSLQMHIFLFYCPADDQRQGPCRFVLDASTDLQKNRAPVWQTIDSRQYRIGSKEERTQIK